VARTADHDGLPSFGGHERRPRWLVRSGPTELGEFGDLVDHHGASVLTQLTPAPQEPADDLLARVRNPDWNAVGDDRALVPCKGYPAEPRYQVSLAVTVNPGFEARARPVRCFDLGSMSDRHHSDRGPVFGRQGLQHGRLRVPLQRVEPPDVNGRRTRRAPRTSRSNRSSGVPRARSRAAERTADPALPEVDAGLAAIAARIVRRAVPSDPVGHDLDQGGPSPLRMRLTASLVTACTACPPVAIHVVRAQAETRRPPVHRRAHLRAGRGRDRPLVVLAEEENRQCWGDRFQAVGSTAGPDACLGVAVNVSSGPLSRGRP
jgi:hypothetical protein